jgi:hypothetical protein
MVRPFFLVVLLSANVLFCSAQIQVSKEPRHHNVFENAWVRILDVHILPGDTSLIHKHSTPSVFMVLSTTKTGSQVIVEPEKANFSDERVWFEGFYTKPRIHRVWNSDTTEFHVVDMELPNKDPHPIDPPMEMTALKLLFDEKPVRGYRLTLAAQTSVRIPHRNAPILVVGLSNAAGNVTIGNKAFIKKGDFLFVKPGKDINFDNKGDGEQSLAVFELK